MTRLPPDAKALEALRAIARLRLDASYKRCAYCEASAGGGLYPTGEKPDHHYDWCPTAIALTTLAALGLSPPRQREVVTSAPPDELAAARRSRPA